MPKISRVTVRRREEYVRDLLRIDPHLSLHQLQQALRNLDGQIMRTVRLSDLRAEVWDEVRAQNPSWQPETRLRPPNEVARHQRAVQAQKKAARRAVSA